MKQLLFIIFLVYSFLLNAQSIRKDYREFTSQEMTDYRAALNSLRTNGTWMALANSHQAHFNTNIHTLCSTCNGEQFLPWHRYFLIEMEWYLRNTSTNAQYLSIPYWDWRTDRSSTNSTHWHQQFLSLSNLSGFTTSPVNLTRNITNTSGSNLATTAQIAGCLGLSSFWISATQNQVGPNSSDFSHRLEHWHNVGHGWIGGTMNSQNSPRDPIFYLHHSMVDFVWQLWEDNLSGIQASFPNGNSPMIHYQTPHYPINVTMNPIRDSRSVTNPPHNTSFSRTNDVWFAFNRKVILDGANGSDFVCSDVSSPYTYRYTAATTTGGTTVEGSMFVGDLQRDASDNVISDSKGGFRVESGVTANFKAGKDITYSPGFWAKSGSNVSARIISTANGNINSEIVESREVSQPPKFNCVVYPNPTSGIINIDGFLPQVENDLEINVYDLTGLRISSMVENLPFGAFSKNIELGNDLKNGIFIVQIIQNGSVHNQKVMLVR